MKRDVDDKMTSLNRKSSGKVRPFGVAEHDNCGWIICESKKDDQRPYYFNVFTRSRAWHLQNIPKSIDMPSYNFIEKRVDNAEVNEEEMPLFSFSDSESEKEEESNEWKIDKNVLLKLYFDSGEEKLLDVDENLRPMDDEDSEDNDGGGNEEEMEKQSTGLSDCLQVYYSGEEDDFEEKKDSDKEEEEEKDDEDVIENNDIIKTIDDEELTEEIDDITDEKWAEFFKLTPLRKIHYNDFIKRPVKKYNNNINQLSEEKINSIVDSVSKEFVKNVVEDAFNKENEPEIIENIPTNLEDKTTPLNSPNSSKDMVFSSPASPAYSMISARAPVKPPKKEKTRITKKREIKKSKKRTKTKKVKKMMQFKMKMTKELEKKKSPVKEVEEVSNKVMKNHLDLSEKDSDEGVNSEMIDDNLKLSEKGSNQEVDNEMMVDNSETSEKGSDVFEVKTPESCDSWSVKSS